MVANNGRGPEERGGNEEARKHDRGDLSITRGRGDDVEGGRSGDARADTKDARQDDVVPNRLPVHGANRGLVWTPPRVKRLDPGESAPRNERQSQKRAQRRGERGTLFHGPGCCQESRP